MVANATAYANSVARLGACPSGPGTGGTCGTLVGSLVTSITPGKNVAVQITPFQASFVVSLGGHVRLLHEFEQCLNEPLLLPKTRAQLYFSCTKPTGNEPLSSYQVVLTYPKCSAPDNIVLNATQGVPNCGATGMYLIIGVSNDCTNDKYVLNSRKRSAVFSSIGRAICHSKPPPCLLPHPHFAGVSLPPRPV